MRRRAAPQGVPPPAPLPSSAHVPNKLPAVKTQRRIGRRQRCQISHAVATAQWARRRNGEHEFRADGFRLETHRRLSSSSGTLSESEPPWSSTRSILSSRGAPPGPAEAALGPRPPPAEREMKSVCGGRIEGESVKSESNGRRLCVVVRRTGRGACGVGRVKRADRLEIARIFSRFALAFLTRAVAGWEASEHKQPLRVAQRENSGGEGVARQCGYISKRRAERRAAAARSGQRHRRHSSSGDGGTLT